MKKLSIFVFISLLFIQMTQAQSMFQKYSGQDVGNPKLKGNFQFDSKLQKFTLTGAGYNLWFERDEFYFVSQPVEGDFIISTSLKFWVQALMPTGKLV